MWSRITAFQAIRSLAIVDQESLHLIRGLPTGRFSPMGYHSCTSLVHLPSFLRIMCPAHPSFFFLMTSRGSRTSDCARISSLCRFLCRCSDSEIPTNRLSNAAWVTLTLSESACVKVQTSEPYVRAGKTMESKS
uniref:Uncharacterized protein n=1 Tax=Caenorhabditis japonica TaxID=281687 RepID=A0A8R1EP46_CAEJA